MSEAGGLDVEALIAGVRRPERTVPICLRGDLLAAWDDLSRQLEARAGTPVTSLADAPAGRDIAEHMTALAAQIAASERVVRLRGLSDRALSDLTAQHPPRTGRDEMWDPTTFPPALLAACAVDPVMTGEQAGRLLETVTRGDAARLFTAALEASTHAVSVPFSGRAYEILSATAER